MTAAATYLVLGLALLLAVVLPGLVRQVAVSPPMVLLGVGMLLGLLPLPEGLGLEPEANRTAILHMTEVTVLIALMGVGLAIERGLSLRSWRSWRSWSAVWRLLALAMPLTVAGVALLGVGVLGLAPAVAILLGGALAPTDPVLASDVQVGAPETEAEEETDEPDEIRFALTAEAGLNDGLAFPFVHLALLLAGGALGVGEVATWLGWYVAAKVLLGTLVGVLLGRLLGLLAFRSRAPRLRLAEQGEPLLALAGLLTAYGAAELVGGYGFIAVFACALTLRAAERRHDYHREMHDVIERLERLLTLAVLLLLGMATTRGLLEHLDWRGVVVALGLVLVIRPLAGWLSLSLAAPDPATRGGLDGPERLAIAFFGVRGVGALYYLAYATTHESFDVEPWLWSTVTFTVVVSVVVHGVTATPVMARLDRRREALEAAAGQ